tara:strand:- start:338 stop:514 length:177 start_codon:yes stop_codon:yes gene_type:complete
MTDLTGKTIANTYKQLLKVGVSTNTGVSAGLALLKLEMELIVLSSLPLAQPSSQVHWL